MHSARIDNCYNGDEISKELVINLLMTFPFPHYSKLLWTI
jgi:hypothetical protein